MADLEQHDSQFVVVERAQLKRLRAVATRLYTEDRMNGDEMRDLGHTITSVLDQALTMADEYLPAYGVEVDHG